jgi:hypothetical protein
VLRGESVKPLAEQNIQCLVLSFGYGASLLDEALIGTESNILHEFSVHEIRVDGKAQTSRRCRRCHGAGLDRKRVAEAPHSILNALEEEFGAELDETRWGCGDYVAEGGAVDVAVDRLSAEELRVVEDVERLDSKL